MSDIDILKLTEDLVMDENLSEEDTKIILKAARERSKDHPLTSDEIAEILHTVRKHTTELSFERTPKLLKAFGVLMILAGCVQFVTLVFAFLTFMETGVMANSVLSELAITSLVVVGIIAVCTVAAMVLSIITGIRLVKGKRGEASQLVLASLATTVLTLTCQLMLYGVDVELIDSGVLLVVQIALSVYLNPSLTRENELRNGLRRIDVETHAKAGTLGLADPGKGFIRLDFFNVFWTFVVCCILGLIIEDVWHMVIVEPGVFQDRAGLLFGPFSPIYGVGAVLMTVCLNRFKEMNVLILFAICTVIGGGFEYLVSLFMQVAFNTIAWDYNHLPTGPLFGGRTCLLFASMFGVLGVIWIKTLLPTLLKLINLIPWKWRYGVTIVCAVLMLVDVLMTFQALDNWSERQRGHVPSTPMEQFYADEFPDDVMHKRFESMSMR